jgi:glutathione S-transferase
MPLTFYYGAGSPFAWRAWLALEHKRIPHERRVLSFDAGDLKKPEFLAVNPRGRVPAIVDGDVTVYESAAILEYLEEAYRSHGDPLFPDSVRDRALVRRMVCEADSYFAPAVLALFRHVILTPLDKRRPERIAAAGDACIAELGSWSREIRGDYLAGALSAVDFTLYPLVALMLRNEAKKPDLGLRERLPDPIERWMSRVESLPFFRKTWPAHWS